MQLLFASLALLVAPALAVEETVELGYSTYKGVSRANGLTEWLGVRYAAAPVGDLRFMPPQDPPAVEGVQRADTIPKSCLEINDWPPDGNGTSEDCLFLGITAPTSATPSSKLPVFFYIQGGGFSKLTNPSVNMSGLIGSVYPGNGDSKAGPCRKASTGEGRFRRGNAREEHAEQGNTKDDTGGAGFVAVQLNYRVGPYGFLTDGDNITPNNGLRDQRKALEWVQDHIASFGGDPSHVVVGGTSAGAASIVFHLMADNGTDRGLFVGAISESASFATTLTTAESQYQYTQLVARTGCAGADSLACLRGRTADEMQAQNFNIVLPGGANAAKYQWLPSLDGEGGMVADYAYRAFREGRFVRVPMILGDTTNGGTVFCPRDTASLAESNQFMLDQYPALTPGQLGEANTLYPNRNLTCPNAGCYWRQISDVYGQARYMCPAMAVNSRLVEHGVPQTWSYLWNVEDPGEIAAGKGVPHTAEFDALVGAEYSDDAPPSYGAGGVNELVSGVIRGYWTSFIQHLDPNVARAGNTARWKEWRPDEQGRARLVFGTGGTTGMEAVDGGLRRRCEFWERHGLGLTQ